MKVISEIDVVKFTGGDLLLEGNSVCYQGRIHIVKTDAGHLTAVLLPFVEKTADGKRWRKHPKKESWNLACKIERVDQETADSVVLTTDEGEKLTLFLKGHRKQLSYDQLRERDIEVVPA